MKSKFVDMIPADSYDRSNLADALRRGEFDKRQLRQRISEINAIFTSLEIGFEAYCRENNFVKTRVPSIVSTIGACENWQTLFKVDHDESFFHLLTQTGQLFLEGALTQYDRVYCITKSFRKEEREDFRHICEFHLMEIEGAFSFEALLEHMRGLYHRICHQVAQDLSTLKVVETKIDPAYIEAQAQAPIPAITYTDSFTLLQGRLAWGDDLSHEHEQALVQELTDGQGPILITHFPKAIKFFNMAASETDDSIVYSADLVLPVSGEAAGGAQREHRIDSLKNRLLDSQMFKHHVAANGTYEDFQPYIDLIEQGLTPLHSGCGIGAERVLQCLLKEKDIRMCSIDHMSKVLFAWDALKL